SDNNRIQVFAPNDIFNMKKINLSQNVALTPTDTPQLVVSGNNVYTIWEGVDTKYNRRDILFKRSMDGGLSFGSVLYLTNSSNIGPVPYLVKTFMLFGKPWAPCIAMTYFFEGVQMAELTRSTQFPGFT
ncbi:MAG: hypothetical protein WAJ93_20695, partial [Candidatus Nitrosopolaris sp.]